jgi:hypothetical protein
MNEMNNGKIRKAAAGKLSENKKGSRPAHLDPQRLTIERFDADQEKSGHFFA